MPKISTSHDTYLHELCYFSIMSLSSHIYFLTRKQKKKFDLACSRTARVIVKFETHARLPMARVGYSPARTSSARWERVPSHPVLVVVHHEGADKFSLRSTFARSFASSVGMRAIIIWVVRCDALAPMMKQCPAVFFSASTVYDRASLVQSWSYI